MEAVVMEWCNDAKYRGKKGGKKELCVGAGTDACYCRCWFHDTSIDYPVIVFRCTARLQDK